MKCEDNPTLDLLRLALIPGLGPRRQRNLLEHFGTPGQVLQARWRELARVHGINRQLAEQIVACRGSVRAQQEWIRCRQRGIRIVGFEDPDYPEPLKTLPTAPQLLFMRGTYRHEDHRAIAIVGSRRCTGYGRRQASRMATGLVEAGYTIVSGLARGIDAVAHRAALEAGGRTIAVLASGLEKIYPPEHRRLATEIAETGLLLSETPTLQTPSAGLFPQRNRLISGLVLAVVVIEATRTSGTLHTVQHALEQAREVLAVPGRVDALTSSGCHDLIRDGAVLVTGPDDVLEEVDSLGPRVAAEPSNEASIAPATREISALEQELLNHLEEHSPLPIDTLLRNASTAHAETLATLTVLELKGLIHRLPGGLIETG